MNLARDHTDECSNVSVHQWGQFVWVQDIIMMQSVFLKCGRLMEDIGCSHNMIPYILYYRKLRIFGKNIFWKDRTIDTNEMNEANEMVYLSLRSS